MTPCLRDPPRSCGCLFGSQPAPTATHCRRRQRWPEPRLLDVSICRPLRGSSLHTSGTPSDNVHSLRVLDECGEIGDFAVFSVAIDLPELQLIVSSRAVPQGAFQGPTRTLLSPPAVARRPFPWGSKWAEYMGAFSLCQDTSSGAAFIVGVSTARGRSIGVYWGTFGLVEVSAA